MSRTPDSGSVDGKVSVASHLLNLPSIATEAFTKNLTSLSSWVTVKTGPWPRHTEGSMADTKRARTANLMEFLLNENTKTAFQVANPFTIGRTMSTVRSNRDSGVLVRTLV